MKVTKQVKSRILLMSFLLAAVSCSDDKINTVDYQSENVDQEQSQEVSTEAVESKVDESEASQKTEEEIEQDSNEIAKAKEEARKERDLSDKEENEQIKDSISSEDTSKVQVVDVEDENDDLQSVDQDEEQEDSDEERVELKIDDSKLRKKVNKKIDKALEGQLLDVVVDIEDSLQKDIEIKLEAKSNLEKFISLGYPTSKDGILEKDKVVTKLMAMKNHNSELVYSAAEEIDFDFSEIEREFKMKALRENVLSYVDRESALAPAHVDVQLEKIIQELKKNDYESSLIFDDILALDKNAIFYFAFDVISYAKFHDVDTKGMSKYFQSINPQLVKEIISSVGTFSDSERRNDVLVELMAQNKDEYLNEVLKGFESIDFNKTYKGHGEDISKFMDNHVISSVIKNNLSRILKKEDISGNELANTLNIAAHTNLDIPELVPALVQFITEEPEEYSKAYLSNVKNAVKGLAKSDASREILSVKYGLNDIATSHDARVALEILDSAFNDKELYDELTETLVSDIVGNFSVSVLGLNTQTTIGQENKGLFDKLGPNSALKVVYVNGYSYDQMFKKINKFEKIMRNIQ